MSIEIEVFPSLQQKVVAAFVVVNAAFVVDIVDTVVVVGVAVVVAIVDTVYVNDVEVEVSAEVNVVSP